MPSSATMSASPILVRLRVQPLWPAACAERLALATEYRTVAGVSGPLVVVECVKVGLIAMDRPVIGGLAGQLPQLSMAAGAAGRPNSPAGPWHPEARWLHGA
jgi:hypothetical protein